VDTLFGRKYYFLMTSYIASNVRPITLAMKRLITILPVFFAVCLSIIAEEMRTNAPTSQVVHTNGGTRLWISSFSPLTVSTEQREWPAVNCTGTPRIL
jgi:hypothetical protein